LNIINGINFATNLDANTATPASPTITHRAPLACNRIAGISSTFYGCFPVSRRDASSAAPSLGTHSRSYFGDRDIEVPTF
jgi:hypothetical protein